MRITKIESSTIFYVSVHEDNVIHNYIRDSPGDWCIRMGASLEPVLLPDKIELLESSFKTAQEQLSTGLTLTFNSEDIMYSLCNKKRGWKLDFFGQEGKELMTEYKDCLINGLSFEFAGICIDPKDSDIEILTDKA